MGSEDPFDSMGLGMAFGYFLYLLRAPFENLRDRIDQFEDKFQVRFSNRAKMIYILVPQLCNCDMSKFEPDLIYFKDTSPIIRDLGGTRDRPFGLSVYRYIKTNELFIIDMATCLDCVLRVRFHNRSLSPERQQAIAKQFLEVLSYLLHSDRACKGLFKLLTFGYRDSFSDVLQKPDIKYTNKPNVCIKNLGTGLAYWYYYNYLISMVQELLETMRLWQNTEEVSLAAEKMYILVPYSCYCPESLKTVKDTNLDYVKDLDDKPKQIGASKNRRYKKSVLQLNNKSGKLPKKIYCIAEYATPILQLYRMYEQFSNKFNSEEKDRALVRHDFVLQLNGLLKNQEKLFEVLTFNDNTEDYVLSDVLLRKVRHRN